MSADTPSAESVSAAAIFRMRVFEEPVVPISGEPSLAENTALVGALRAYSERSSPDDFSSLTNYLTAHPESPWNASLLTNLGIEYFKTGRYSMTLGVWSQAWHLAKSASDPTAKAVADSARTVKKLLE
jgi:hypothetical protein